MVQYCEKYPNEVALLASFTPVFEQKQPQEAIEIFEDEVPEQIELNPNEKYCFIFLIDRSGSMRGDRIDIAKNALQLFLKSLPPNSAFQITSFGTKYQHLTPNVSFYDDKSLDFALAQVEQFDADFGGTNIFDPLTDIINYMKVPQGYAKRVFALTDGKVSSREKCIDLACQNSDRIRFHTFGIGTSCDKALVEGMAQAGRGTASFASDQNNDLRPLVINALKHACEPSLQGCKLQWNGNTEPLGELFRNELVTQARIVDINTFEQLRIYFTCQQDPTTQQPIDVVFSKNDFEIIENGDQLFKHAAQNQMNQPQSSSIKTQLSIKYQVLNDLTAMIAVVKQKEKTTGELKEYTVPFENKIQRYHQPVSGSSARRARRAQKNKISGGFGGSAYNPSPSAQQKQIAKESAKFEMNCEMMCDAMDYGQEMKSSYSQNQQYSSYQSQDVGLGMCMASAAPAMSMAQESSSNELDDLEARLAALSMDYTPPTKSASNTQKKQEIKPVQKKTSGKSSPSFDQLINFQSSSGNWDNSCGQILASFFTNNTIDDKNLKDQLIKLNTSQITQIWHTIIALFILERSFDNIADEWEMIARKAKTWLKQNGVAKPESYIKQVPFTLVM